MFDDDRLASIPPDKAEYEKWEHEQAAIKACANIPTEDLENGAILNLVKKCREILEALYAVNVDESAIRSILRKALEPFKEVK